MPFAFACLTGSNGPYVSEVDLREFNEDEFPAEMIALLEADPFDWTYWPDGDA